MTVKNGTPNFGKTSLCDTCRYSLVMKGVREDEKRVYCSIMTGDPVPITFPVAECSDYSEKGKLSRCEMDSMAWIIDVRKEVAGFKPGDVVVTIEPPKKKQ